MTNVKEQSQLDQEASTVNQDQFRRNHLLLFILVSLLVHSLGLLFFDLYKRTQPITKNKTESKPIEFIVVPPEEATDKPPPETQKRATENSVAKQSTQPEKTAASQEIGDENSPNPTRASSTSIPPEVPTPAPKIATPSPITPSPSPLLKPPKPTPDLPKIATSSPVKPSFSKPPKPSKPISKLPKISPLSPNPPTLSKPIKPPKPLPEVQPSNESTESPAKNQPPTLTGSDSAISALKPIPTPAKQPNKPLATLPPTLSKPIKPPKPLPEVQPPTEPNEPPAENQPPELSRSDLTTPEPKPEPKPEPTPTSQPNKPEEDSEVATRLPATIKPSNPIPESTQSPPQTSTSSEQAAPSDSDAASLLGGDYKRTIADGGGDAFFSPEALAYKSVLNPSQLNALKDIDLSEYFAEVKRRVKRNWQPSFAVEEYTTFLTFAIEQNGQITGLRVSKSSGSERVDRESLEAVQDAAPFAPLPSGFPLEALEVEFSFNIYIY